MLACTALCTSVAHNTAQNRPDNSPSPSRQSSLLPWWLRLFAGRGNTEFVYTVVPKLAFFSGRIARQMGSPGKGSMGTTGDDSLKGQMHIPSQPTASIHLTKTEAGSWRQAKAVWLTVGNEWLGKLAEEQLQQTGDDVDVLPLVTVGTQRHWVLQTSDTCTTDKSIPQVRTQRRRHHCRLSWWFFYLHWFQKKLWG